MTATPLLPRQRDVLAAEVIQASDNPAFVVVYDTQSIDDVVKTLTGRVVGVEEVTGAVARFRLSNYLPTGELLVERFKEAAIHCEWIILHTGTSVCPEPVLELFQHLCGQEFSTPRVVVVGEHLDVRSGDRRMIQLFSLGRLVNLTSREVW